jgi:hypothetical protein
MRQPQIANVENMFREQCIRIPERYWFVCTRPRAKVQRNDAFKRLRKHVETGEVGTVYIESQDGCEPGDKSFLAVSCAHVGARVAMSAAVGGWAT